MELTIELLLSGIAIAGIVWVIINQNNLRGSVKTDLLFIKQDVDGIKQNQMMADMIAKQVNIQANAGPKTVSNLRLTEKLSKALMSMFSMNELEGMAYELGLNGDIDWQTKQTAVTTILQSMDRNDKLMDLVRYVEEQRDSFSI